MIWMIWSWKYGEVEKSLAAEIFPSPVHFWIQTWRRWRKLRPMRAEESLERELLKSSSVVQQLGLTTEDVLWNPWKIIGDFPDSWKVGCVHTLSRFPPKKKWFIVENPSINGWFGGAPWIGNLWKPQHLHGPKKATTEVFQGRPEGNHRSSRRNRRRCGEWTDLSHGLKMLKMCGLIWLICIYIYMH